MTMPTPPELSKDLQERLKQWYGDKIKYKVAHFWDTGEVTYCAIEILSRKLSDFEVELVRLVRDRDLILFHKDGEIARWKNEKDFNIS